MQLPGAPQPGSKEGPSGSAVKAAQQEKQQTELTVIRYQAMLRTQGVYSFSTTANSEGINIRLLAKRNDGKTIEVNVLCPKGHPFPVYAMQAYEELLSVQEGRADPDSGIQYEDAAPAAPVASPQPAPQPAVSGGTRLQTKPKTPRKPITTNLCAKPGCQQPEAWAGHLYCSPTCAREHFQMKHEQKQRS